MKVIFLDRDGVINRYPGHREYVKSWAEFRFLPGVKKALALLTGRGFKVFVISNQAGVGKGIYAKEALDELTQKMLQGLVKYGAKIHGVYYCTHTKEERCPCRKPKTGLIEIARRRHSLNIRGAYFVGDTIRDVHTARAAGLKSILVLSGKEKFRNKKSWEVQPDFVFPDLWQAVKFLLAPKK
jgi:histidinol-phosphate phosphatase family protein